jgi:beta-lactamase regulating signal transducer with metallopeptidase domain
MVVETIFWFHPLVWWLGARLLEERERACDERVSELGSERQIYAESILRVCEFCLRSPLACMSGLTGADLKKRMVYIMGERVVRKLNFGKKLLLSAAAFVAMGVPIIFGLMTATQGRAQSQDEGTATVPAFVTPSLKPDKSSGRVALMIKPDGMTATNVPPQMLLREAYKVEDSRR